MTALDLRSDAPLRLVDLSGDVANAGATLGALTDAILAGRAAVLVFDLGKSAVDPRLLTPMVRWFRRNETLIRTRTSAHVLVVPRLWHAIQWRLAMLFESPVVPTTLVRSRAAAVAWVRAARPSPRG